MKSDLNEKVKLSIERIKHVRPDAMGKGDSYHVAFSGGKDSVVLKALMDMAGVKYTSHYRVTSADPPELVQFIKEKYQDVNRDKPYYKDETDKYGNPVQITMWNLIPRKLMPPTRLLRYCCEKLKESSGDGKLTVTGVRWAESVARAKNHGSVTIMDRRAAKDLEDDENFQPTRQGGVVLVNDNVSERRLVEACMARRKVALNPIIDWTDADVWEFIKAENVPYCGLYEEGFHRLGCIGCPMARRSGREKEFARWPKYKMAYLKAFDRMLRAREERGKQLGSWRMGTMAQDVFNWWMEYDVLPGQMDLFEEVE